MKIFYGVVEYKVTEHDKKLQTVVSRFTDRAAY